MSPDRRCALIAAVALGVGGCASERPLHSWRAVDLAHVEALGGTTATATTGRSFAALLATYRKVVQAAGPIAPELLVAEGEAPNAYTFEAEGRPVIAVNLPLLALLGDDPDAVAALLGHELAHVYLRHQTRRQDRIREQENVSGLLGFLLSAAGVPFGATLVDAAATTVERSHSRDDEREADRLGVEFMRRAGFDPQGAVRLQEKLAAGGPAILPFLATHPSGAERIEAMRALSPREPAE